MIGLVNDKDITHILELLPKDAIYYFTRATVARALPAENLKEQAKKAGLKGNAFANVKDAYLQAKQDSSPEDLIFIGGSNFIVGDLLLYLEGEK